MNVREFGRNLSSEVAKAVATDEPRPITNRDAPYAHVVSDTRLKQLIEAEDILHGLLRLRARGADFDALTNFGELLDDLINQGKLNVRAPEPVTTP